MACPLATSPPPLHSLPTSASPFYFATAWPTPCHTCPHHDTHTQQCPLAHPTRGFRHYPVRADLHTPPASVQRHGARARRRGGRTSHTARKYSTISPEADRTRRQPRIRTHVMPRILPEPGSQAPHTQCTQAHSAAGVVAGHSRLGSRWCAGCTGGWVPGPTDGHAIQPPAIHPARAGRAGLTE